MGIKRATLYYQPKGNLDKKIKETDIKNKIKDISYKHPYYGYRRITAQLRRDQVIINHKKVLKMMKELGIQGRIKRKYIATTNSKHNNRIYSNLIKDKELTGINQVWCADITYIRILWIEPLRLDTLSLNTPYIPESYSLPVASCIPLEADSPRRNRPS